MRLETSVHALKLVRSRSAEGMLPDTIRQDVRLLRTCLFGRVSSRHVLTRLSQIALRMAAVIAIGLLAQSVTVSNIERIIVQCWGIRR